MRTTSNAVKIVLLRLFISVPLLFPSFEAQTQQATRVEFDELKRKCEAEGGEFHSAGNGEQWWCEYRCGEFSERTCWYFCDHLNGCNIIEWNNPKPDSPANTADEILDGRIEKENKFPWPIIAIAGWLAFGLLFVMRRK